MVVVIVMNYSRAEFITLRDAPADAAAILQNMSYLLLPEERLAMQISRQPGPEVAGWALELCAAPLLLL